MKSRAAVAWEAGKPLVIEAVDIEGPKNGEVLLRVKATGSATPTLTLFRARTRRESFLPSWATRATQSYWKSLMASPVLSRPIT